MPQGSHLDATEAVKAIKLVKGQEKAFKRKIPFAILFTRTSTAIRPRTLQSVEAEFAEKHIPMLSFVDHADQQIADSSGPPGSGRPGQVNGSGSYTLSSDCSGTLEATDP